MLHQQDLHRVQHLLQITLSAAFTTVPENFFRGALSIPGNKDE